MCVRRRPPVIVHLHLVASLSLLLFSWTASAVDTSVFSPATLDDGQGNTADEKSDISFREISNTRMKSIECSGCVGDGGIRPFLKTAGDFAKIVAPNFPYKTIEEISDHSFHFKDDYNKLIHDNMGLVVCAGIGLLFILIFPIVGCFFCCCRCCGKCGGSRKTDGEPETGCYRKGFAFALFVLAIFVGTGGAMVFSTGSSITGGLNSVHDDVPGNIDAVIEFLNDTNTAMLDMATVDLNFTRKVIFRDLDNIGYILGGTVRQLFLDETKNYIDGITKSVKGVDAALTDLKKEIPEINDRLDDTKKKAQDYITAMKTIKDDFDAKTKEKAPDIAITIDIKQLKKFDGKQDIDKVGNLTEKLDNSLKEIDRIPGKVQGESMKAVKETKESIVEYTSSASKTTHKLDLNDRIHIDYFKDDVRDFSDKVMKYDKYRNYAFMAIGGIILLITLLLLLGLVLGVCGGSGDTPPDERGCVSNSGGNFLIAAVVLTFLFGSLLMLPTTILFAVGAPLESYGCGVVRDTTILDKLINEYHILRSKHGPGNYLADKILHDPNKTLTVTEIASACKKDEAIFNALRINESNYYNLSKILHYKSQFDVEDKMSSVKINFANINILKGGLSKQIEDLNGSIHYNFTMYNSELDRNTTKEALEFKRKLQQDMLSPATPTNFKAVYTSTIAALQAALDKQGKDLQESMATLKSQIDRISDILSPPPPGLSLSDEIGRMKTAMVGLDAIVEQAGKASFNKGRDIFIDRIFHIADAYTHRLLRAVTHDIGRCKPIWNAYNSMFVENLCDTLIASLNGFWFAIGWSLFFMMPSIIIAVKLANHFRTMSLYQDDADYEGDNRRSGLMTEMTEKHRMMPYNKVGPMDTPRMEMVPL